MKKFFEVVKRVISTIVFVVYFIFALLITILLLNFNDYGVSVFDDKSLILIDSKISNDNYKKGDLVIVESLKLEKYKKGDYIFTYKVGNDRIATVQLGKINNIYKDEDAISLENGENYSSEFIAGVPVKKYKNLGSLLAVVESKWGFLFLILIPVFLIFIFEVYSLIIEIKYGKNED